MTIDNLKISREVQLGSKWISIGATLSEGEDPLKALTEIDQTINNYIQLTGVPVEEPPKVINRAYERVEILINDCLTMEELAVHKEYANKNPDIMPIYMNKAKQLTNGLHTNKV